MKDFNIIDGIIDVSSIISSIGTIDSIGICPIDDHQTIGIQLLDIINQFTAFPINN
jgi:hypothetical protein